MADPITLTAIAAGAAIAGAGVSAYGQISSANQNREIAEQQARQEEAQGRDEFAASQREMIERKLAGKLAMLRLAYRYRAHGAK